MGYREETEALRAKLEVAERARAAAEARAIEAEKAAAGVPTVAALEGDLWFRLARIALVFQAALWPIAVIGITPAYIAMAYEEMPFGSVPPLAQGLLMSLAVAAFLSPPAIAAAVARWLLPREPRGGFVAALAAAGLSFLWWPCLPLGVIVLVGLFRPAVRAAFFPRAPRPSAPEPATSSASSERDR